MDSNEMKKIEIYCKINSNRMDRKNYAPYAFFLSKCQDFKYFFIIDRIKINVHCIINNKKSVHLIDKRHSQHIFFFYKVIFHLGPLFQTCLTWCFKQKTQKSPQIQYQNFD